MPNWLWLGEKAMAVIAEQHKEPLDAKWSVYHIHMIFITSPENIYMHDDGDM